MTTDIDIWLWLRENGLHISGNIWREKENNLKNQRLLISGRRLLYANVDPAYVIASTF